VPRPMDTVLSLVRNPRPSAIPAIGTLSRLSRPPLQNEMKYIYDYCDRDAGGGGGGSLGGKDRSEPDPSWSRPDDDATDALLAHAAERWGARENCPLRTHGLVAKASPGLTLR